jgi:hypothetical protein
MQGGGQQRNMPIEEAKNSDAEEESLQEVSPGHMGKKHIMSGDHSRREGNAVGGLMKKIRVGS